PPPTPRPAREPTGGRAAPGQGRRNASPRQGLGHVVAGPRDAAAHARALLERRRTGRRSHHGRVHGPSPSDGGRAAVPARPLRLRGPVTPEVPLLVPHALT